MDKEPVGIVVHAVGKTGVLHQLTGVIAQHDGDITSVEILDNWPNPARTYFEVVLPDDPESLVADLRRLTIVRQVEIVKTLDKIYGKRIIIVGGGAQSRRDQFLAVARCMRSHGVSTFPDPTHSPPPPSSGNAIGGNGWYLALGTAPERASPAYRRAAAACRIPLTS